MASRRNHLWPVVAIITGIFVFLIALPQEWKNWAPSFLRAPSLHLGLDLAGGAQLDFRISEEEIEGQLANIRAEIATLESTNGDPERISRLGIEEQSILEQQRNLTEAIRTVLEKRVNGLGVSEATITPSFIGDEKHLLVEFPGIIDIQQAIDVVGKTIQLEFKEEFTELTEDFTKEVNAKVASTIARITKSGSTLLKEGQDLGDELGVVYQEHISIFKDNLPKGLENLWDAKPSGVVRRDGSIVAPRQDENGNVTEETVPGIFLAEVLGPRTQTGRVINEAPKAFAMVQKTQTGMTYVARQDTLLDAKVDPTIVGTLQGMQPGNLKAVETSAGNASVLFLRSLVRGKEEMDVSLILISYKGAEDTEPTVTRTKEEALQKAQDIKKQLDGGADFATIARRESDSPLRNQGGKLGKFTRGSMLLAFEEAAFKLTANAVSAPVDTQFGYYIIRADSAPVIAKDVASFDQLQITGTDALNRGNSIISQMQSGDIRTVEEVLPLRLIFFSLQPTGWKDTALDGKHFRTASVTVDPVTNIPVVQIIFDEEGGRIFQELTKRNIQKRIAIFVGGDMVSAPTVQQEISGGIAVITGSQNFEEARRLAQDLNTGAIPAPIHLVGQHTVEATLGDTALQTSLQAAIIGIVILMIYMLVVYRLLGLIANVALLIYAALFFAILKLPLFLLSDTYIVLTLAGMAGIILSLGMAVDANVLVFERMKEELRKGKLVKTAVETSFIHAWPAIRDGNVSTLITCAILFLIGTSLVRGFAITLGMGVLLSMFTAITVTRWILRRIALMPIAERRELFGVKGSQNQAQ